MLQQQVQLLRANVKEEGKKKESVIRAELPDLDQDVTRPRPPVRAEPSPWFCSARSVRLSGAGGGVKRQDAHLFALAGTGERAGRQPAVRRCSSRALLVPSRVIPGNMFKSSPPEDPEKVLIDFDFFFFFVQSVCSAALAISSVLTYSDNQ